MLPKDPCLLSSRLRDGEIRSLGDPLLDRYVEFVSARARPNTVRLSDGEQGLSSRTIKRRLATLSGLFGFLVMLEEMPANPVPRGLSTRRREVVEVNIYGCFVTTGVGDRGQALGWRKSSVCVGCSSS